MNIQFVKKGFLISFGLLFFSIQQHNAQILEFEWAKKLGGVESDESYSVAVDNTGNVYTTGFFHGTADFDPGSETFELISNGDKDVFISKLDHSGNFEWAVSIGGTGLDQSFSITTDNENNVYITGSFEGTVDFNPGDGINNLTATETDIFILKLDSDGNYIWARNFGGPGTLNTSNAGVLKSIAVDDNQNVYISGSFSGTVDFDPGTGDESLSSAGSFDIFIAKYDNNGDYVWAKNIGGTGSDEGTFIAVDLNALYVTGSFNGTVDFNPSDATDIHTATGMDMYITKFDIDGNYEWTKTMGGGFVNVSLSVAVNKQSTGGNIYLAGYFFGSTDFDPGPESFTLTSAGSIDAFVCKLDAMGNFIWVKNMGGTGSDLATYIVANQYEDIFVTGYFQNTAHFDPGSDVYTLTSSGGNDAYILVLNSDGEFILAESVGGAGSDFGSSIATDNYGNIYTTGGFSETADFDPGSGVYNLTSSGFNDIFVHKLAVPCTNSTTHIAEVSCGDTYIFNEVTYTTSDIYEINLTSELGCDSTIILDLTILNIDKSISVVDNTLSANESEATYQWIDCISGEIIDGATSQTFTPTISGTYAAIIYKVGCSDTSECETISGLSVYDEGESIVSIYPNPFIDKIMIISAFNMENATLQLINVLGQTVFTQQNVNGKNVEINFDTLPQGLYYMEIYDQNAIFRKKLMKK